MTSDGAGGKFIRKVGPWRVTSERAAFDNPWINLTDHRVIHPDGSPGEYGVVRFKNVAVGVLPVAADGTVPLVGQHRFPLDRYSWELPEGGAPRSEEPLAAAKRELAEETGFTARSWLELGRFDVSNSVTDEIAICYLAWDLTPGEAAPEPSEALRLKTVSFKALLEMVMSGEITDSLTIVMTQTAYIKALRAAAPAPICKLILEACG